MFYNFISFEFVLCIGAALALAALGGWHAYLVSFGQTSIELHVNKRERSRLKKLGLVRKLLQRLSFPQCPKNSVYQFRVGVSQPVRFRRASQLENVPRHRSLWKFLLAPRAVSVAAHTEWWCSAFPDVLFRRHRSGAKFFDRLALQLSRCCWVQFKR